MAIKDNISVKDYVKINELKNYVMAHLKKMGLEELLRTVNDDDLEKIMYMMSIMGEQLSKKENADEKIEMLISYIICMWTKLIVEYGASLKEL
jgi:hypothetical protein